MKTRKEELVEFSEGRAWGLRMVGCWDERCALVRVVVGDEQRSEIETRKVRNDCGFRSKVQGRG